MNIRGPFGEPVLGRFSQVAITHRTQDRPKVTHRGVRVMVYDGNMLTQVHEYPDATGWYIETDGQLDIRNEDSHMHVVASYPGQKWDRVWFPGAEEKARFELPTPANEDEFGEREDVEPNEG